MVLTVDLDKSDLPLPDRVSDHDDQPAELVRRHQGRAPRGARRPARSTEVELSPRRARSRPRFLVAPDGREQPLLAAEGAAKVTVGPLDRCGVWSVVERATAAPAKNANSPRPMPSSERPRRASRHETLDRARLQPGRPPRERPAARRRACPAATPSLAAGFAVRPIWYYLLVSALMLTCWEWFLYQRRWID